MKGIKSAALRYVAALLAVLGMGLLMPHNLQAQQNCDTSPFLAQTSWSGTVKTTVSGSGVVTQTNGDTVTYNIQQSINLAPVVGSLQGVFYSGVENATVNVNESFVVKIQGVTTTTTDTIVGNGFIASPLGGIGAVLSFASCSYSMATFAFFIPGTVNGQSAPVGFGPLNGPSPIPPDAPIWMVPLPASGLTLSGSVSFDTTLTGTFGEGPCPVHVVTTWSLTPTPPDLDVIVTIPDYANWRPTAVRSEKETGTIDTVFGTKFNLLDIHAQLVVKSTGKQVLFNPDKWTFSLVKVSKEPGVVMNWPQQGKTTADPDMTFEQLACATGSRCEAITDNLPYHITNNGTTADFVPTGRQGLFAEALILLSPHDWGGWATLNVTATVNGLPKPILGHLSADQGGNPNETNILLPQRQAGSFIANSWKNAHGVALNTIDADDSEDKPNGDGQPGDGFTLYQEYRGFYMGCSTNNDLPGPEGALLATCQHVEGDPTKKDFFVVQELSPIMDVGIERFKKATGLNVHYLGLTRDEISQDRTINFNHSAEAPHEQSDQHAVIMVRVHSDGISQTVGGPGLPGKIQQIKIADTLHSGDGPDPGSNSYVKTVAHELAHSANVYHHGEIDKRRVQWSEDPNGNGDVIETLLDLQGKPVAGTELKVYVFTEDVDLSKPLTGKGLPLDLPVRVYVGNDICGIDVMQNGQHSGDVASFMRYAAAQAYIPDGFPLIRVWVGSEAPGFDLTDNPGGTGVNLPGRKPRVRYGDAYDGPKPVDAKTRRGNDSAQLDVNDNNTDNVRKPNSCPVGP